jgi:hypothetical protein
VLRSTKQAQSSQNQLLQGAPDEFPPIAGPRSDSPDRTGGEDVWRHHHPRHGEGKADGGRGRCGWPGARGEDGKIHPLDVKVGDRVLFGKWSGTEIKLDGEDLMIMKESDLLGVIEGKTSSKHKAA